jgi:hypothetical protein
MAEFRAISQAAQNSGTTAADQQNNSGDKCRASALPIAA